MALFSRKGDCEESPGDEEVPAGLLGDLALPPLRLGSPTSGKPCTPLSAARAWTGLGDGDLAWLWAQLHAIQDFGTVALTSHVSSGLGTCLWVCVRFRFPLHVPRRPPNRCQVKSKQRLVSPSAGSRSSASASRGPPLEVQTRQLWDELPRWSSGTPEAENLCARVRRMESLGHRI